jgi:hypothetical protein
MMLFKFELPKSESAVEPIGPGFGGMARHHRQYRQQFIQRCFTLATSRREKMSAHDAVNIEHPYTKSDTLLQKLT